VVIERGALALGSRGERWCAAPHHPRRRWCGAPPHPRDTAGPESRRGRVSIKVRPRHALGGAARRGECRCKARRL